MLFTLQLGQQTKENTQQCLWVPYLQVPRGVRWPLAPAQELVFSSGALCPCCSCPQASLGSCTTCHAHGSPACGTFPPLHSPECPCSHALATHTQTMLGEWYLQKSQGAGASTTFAADPTKLRCSDHNGGPYLAIKDKTNG